MSTNEILFAVVASSLVLIINWRALASHQVPRGRMIRMGLIWLGIIIVLTAVITRLSQ